MLSIDEYDLINFFGTAPTQLDHDVPWQYNDSTYEVADSQLSCSCEIAPSFKHVRVILKMGEKSIYALDAMCVADVKINNDKGRESLEVIVSERESILLQIKPQISVHQLVASTALE